jgi:hypothetical protein
MAPGSCFEDVTFDGTNTILLIPEKGGFNIDEQLMASVPRRNRK